MDNNLLVMQVSDKIPPSKREFLPVSCQVMISSSGFVVVFFQKTHCLLVDCLPQTPTHTEGDLNAIHKSDSLSVLFSVVSPVPTKLNGDAPGFHYSFPGYSLLGLSTHSSHGILSGSVYHHQP